MAVSLAGGSTVLMVELMALREALSWTVVYYRGRVIVELDCLEAVNGLNNASCDWAVEERVIIEECRKIAQEFHSVRFVHTKREYNKIAHRLAHMAMEHPGFKEWLEEIPEEIEDEYLKEIV